jgi:hypothetical protein
VGGGTVTVDVAVKTYDGGEYTASCKVSIIPHVTTVEIVNIKGKGSVALGQTVRAKVNVLGGGEYDYESFPALTYKWSYYEPYSTEFTDIPGETGRTFAIPETAKAGEQLHVDVIGDGNLLAEKSVQILAESDGSGSDGSGDDLPDKPEPTGLEAAAKALGEWYKLAPVFGKDTNVADMVLAALAEKGFADIGVTVRSAEEVYGGAGIGGDGKIAYFYADPNGSHATWFGQFKVTFALAKGGETLELADIPVTVHWDAARVEETMRGEILSKVTETAILGENESQNAVVSDLILPKAVDGKRWALIEWDSSNTAALSNDGKVVRGEADKEATLTAAFNFQLTHGAPPIVLYKTFTVTVKALPPGEADAERAALLKKLEDGLASAGLRDFVTGERLVMSGETYLAANDIRLPTTRDFGVDGKYFPITISSGDSEVISAPDTANAARVTVWRPPVGAPAKTASLTLTITDTAKGITASKDLAIEAQPLTQAELDDALALMDMAKAGYFGGLNDGRYADEFSVTGGLRSFQEAAWSDASKTGVRWIYNHAETTGGGIIADELENWADQEAWRAFRSSDMTVLAHETLNYATQPAEDTFVRVNSALTHAALGKYAGRPGYAGFERLYRQQVAAYVMVEGKNHKERAPEELERLRDEAIAKLSTPISAGFALFGTRAKAQPRARAAVPSSGTALIDTTVSGLEAGSTVFELFRKALAQNGYTYEAVGSYVKSITDPDGNTLAERDSGPNSGWIYLVNGRMPSIYMNGFSLKEGDEVVVRFTSDYNKENWDFGANDNVSGNGSGIGGSGRGGSGSGGSAAGPFSVALNGPFSPLSSAAVANAVKSAATKAERSLTVKFQNISEVAKAVFDAIAKAANGKPAEASFDSMNGRNVDVRITIDPSKVNGSLNMAASTTSRDAKTTKAVFERFFYNKTAVVSFQQENTFGIPVKAAAKANLTAMDAARLVLYSYDSKTNTYRRIETPAYRIDANGYLHFTTHYAGDIVISEGELKKR